MDKKHDELKDDRDSELDDMLERLRGTKPTEAEVQRWQSLALGLASRDSRRSKAWSMIAAAAVGAVIGSIVANRLWQNPVSHQEKCTSHLVAEVNNANATFETTYDKLD